MLTLIFFSPFCCDFKDIGSRKDEILFSPSPFFFLLRTPPVPVSNRKSKQRTFPLPSDVGIYIRNKGGGFISSFFPPPPASIGGKGTI